MRIREYAPLCLTQDSSWGGVATRLARTGAASMIRLKDEAAKDGRTRNTV